MADAGKELKNQIDEVVDEIKALNTRFFECVENPAKVQDKTRTFEDIKVAEKKLNELLIDLARLYHPDL